MADGGADGRTVPVLDRTERRRHRAPHDGRRTGWSEPPGLGGVGLPADLDDRHPAVRQDVGSVRASGRVPDRHRRVPDRLGPVRPGPDDEPAGRGQGGPGPRWRWADVVGLRHRRRRGLAAGAGPLHRRLHRRVHRLRGDRADLGWAPGRRAGLAMGVLDRRPDRPCCPRRDQPWSPPPLRHQGASHRLARHRPADRGLDRSDPRPHLGWRDLRLDVGPAAGHRCGRPRRVRAVPPPGGQGPGADHPPPPVHRSHRRPHLRDGVPAHGIADLGLDLPPPLPPGLDRRLGHPQRPPADPAEHRDQPDRRGQRLAGVTDRSLQVDLDRRPNADRRRPRVADQDRPGHRRHRPGPTTPALRVRSRSDLSQPHPDGAERVADRGPRHRHLDVELLPQHGWGVRGRRRWGGHDHPARRPPPRSPRSRPSR